MLARGRVDACTFANCAPVGFALCLAHALCENAVCVLAHQNSFSHPVSADRFLLDVVSSSWLPLYPVEYSLIVRRPCLDNPHPTSGNMRLAQQRSRVERVTCNSRGAPTPPAALVAMAAATRNAHAGPLDRPPAIATVAAATASAVDPTSAQVARGVEAGGWKSKPRIICEAGGGGDGAAHGVGHQNGEKVWLHSFHGGRKRMVASSANGMARPNPVGVGESAGESRASGWCSAPTKYAFVL